ncbi:asparagine synthase (glutamine-hydrolyzing) [Marinobacter vulgaris]|uniref:asparagine synthase (glutamine-hydrolyzing) n=1 Tax=Marinobacter vulgaris TaxID=1928331 RepID=A0A2V3ZIM6_9GAMM|nr:asparagine synthase (glutamine-hydrolyzing) [Marinobacter vulgaris]PXX90715.1 asparagine synthase (glutamine-hydrolyzing) [Marinobacter vulgaris]TSJ70313.1 asparagine synthase (glutamine-hydrolyzing) [Marinobacter vulgaris]
MCGFSGFVTEVECCNSKEAILGEMSHALYHRGPDAEGFWQDKDVGVALVHRRLAIQDLSPQGAQPMLSSSGRYVIAFNGEIYNFESLKLELLALGAEFVGHSDTEVMLAAFEYWGIAGSLDRFAGMFAFALVDRAEKQLILARDRMGEKPLYYGWQGGTLLFGSELKPLAHHPDWQGEINRDALPFLLRHNLIPAPFSIYVGIRKLQPASMVTFDLDGLVADVWPVPQRYWKLEDQFAESSDWSFDSASERLESLLTEVVGEQMVSDVPLGAFLSGGIDSSTVVALMQKQSKQPVRTFSIGFREEGFNEAEHAAAVARHLGTEHTEFYATEQDALEVIPRLAQIYDEPFADSSQIPTYLVSKITREHVTVALSGDGGDELFCGYTRYPSTLSAWRNRHTLKARVRDSLSKLPSVPTSHLTRALVPSQRRRSAMAVRKRLESLGALADAGSLSEFYRQRVSLWSFPETALIKGAEPAYSLTSSLPSSIPDESLKTLMWRDLNWYLPDDILVKVDRAAMACSLETRVPLLDHRVVEFALGLPTSLNMDNGVGKQVLRSVLYRHVPRELIDRPKQGFAVPIAAWLRGALRDWAEELLEPAKLKEEGFWNVETVRWFWSEHISGREDYSFQLWGVLMFQQWLRTLQ